MMLSSSATLKELAQTASLQAWHMKTQLEQGQFTPFQCAYFLHELADATVQIVEDMLKADPTIVTKFAELAVTPVAVKPVLKKPAVRKPRARAKKAAD